MTLFTASHLWGSESPVYGAVTMELMMNVTQIGHNLLIP